MLRHTVHLAKRAGMRGGRDVLVAVDKHLIPRFDVGRMLFLVFAARKNGTNRFEAYATMQIVAGPINAVLDCEIHPRHGQRGFVCRFVHILDGYEIHPRLMLVDREFFAVDVMLALNGLDKRFLMPATKKPGIKRAVLEHHRGRRAVVSSYAMRTPWASRSRTGWSYRGSKSDPRWGTTSRKGGATRREQVTRRSWRCTWCLPPTLTLHACGAR